MKKRPQLRFFLFAGDNHYPAGGWRDIEGRFSSQRNAFEAAAQLHVDWWHIVDVRTGEMVDSSAKLRDRVLAASKV